MFGINLDELKEKAERALEFSAEKAAEAIELSKKTGKFVAKEIIEASETAVDNISTNVTLSSMDSNLKEGLCKVLDAAKDTLDSANDMLDKKEIIMEHKIIMMGGKRAGKSTVLSSILTQLSKNTPGTICTIEDDTDNDQIIETKNGPKPLPSLLEKHREVKEYIKKKQVNTEFLVDMSPTYGKASYVLEVSADNSAINLEFIDVPGEWMILGTDDHKELINLVKESDVFVIVIDSPFLMNSDTEEGKGINSVYNRIEEITQTMLKMEIESPADLKQIIFCPIKCERWVQEGKTDILVEKVKKSYRNLINKWLPHKEVTIQIMPIETVGGLESTRMLPSILYFRDDNDPTGTQCSKDPLTGLLMDKNGKTIRPTSSSREEEDTSMNISHTDIPLSWYKINGKGYLPRFCEQPGFHILKFLVEKEENILKMKADAEQNKYKDIPWWMRWVVKVFQPTFGEYLPVWQKVIDELSRGNYIKTEGDGFCFVREQIK